MIETGTRDNVLTQPFRTLFMGCGAFLSGKARDLLAYIALYARSPRPVGQQRRDLPSARFRLRQSNTMTEAVLLHSDFNTAEKIPWLPPFLTTSFFPKSCGEPFRGWDWARLWLAIGGVCYHTSRECPPSTSPAVAWWARLEPEVRAFFILSRYGYFFPPFSRSTFRLPGDVTRAMSSGR